MIHGSYNPPGYDPSSPTPGFHPGLAVALWLSVKNLLDSSLISNSKKTYDRAWQIFQCFHLSTYGMAGSLPLTPDKVALFVKMFYETINGTSLWQTHICFGIM